MGRERNIVLHRNGGFLIVLGLGLGLLWGLAGCRREEPPTTGAKTAEATEDQATDPARTETTSTPNSAAGAEGNEASPDRPANVSPVVRVTVALDPALEEAYTDIIRRWDDVESLYAEIASTLDQKQELTQEREGVGKYELKKSNGDLRIRLRVLTNVTLPRDDDELVFTRQYVTTVRDGPYVYILDQTYKSMEAYKTWAARHPVPQLGGPGLIRVMQTAEHVERLPDKKIRGKECYVIRTETGGKRSGTYYVDKRTGLLLQSEVEDKTRERTASVRITKVEINPELSDEIFTLELPEGVELEDRTVEPGAGTSDNRSP